MNPTPDLPAHLSSLRPVRSLLAPLAAALACTAVMPAALAAGTAVRFDAADIAGAPFPSNRFTVPDFTQRTLRRVDLPKPDCAVRPNDCADVDVLNTLDGFSTQPRITIPFDGDIDPSTVNSNTVYLVNLGDTITLRGYGERVGINQRLWDPASKTLVVQSDQLLQQHSRYLLVITDGVRDALGQRIVSGAWDEASGQSFSRDRTGAAYRSELRAALQALLPGSDKIVAGSLFTTQSVSADLTKIGARIRNSSPAAIDFRIGRVGGGRVRAVFPVVSLQDITLNSQNVAGPTLTPTPVPTSALGVFPDSVAAVAYGRFRSPDYQTAARVIPATGTLTGQPQRQGHNDLIVQVFIPAGSKPAGGWPVALFGHGFTDSIYGAPWTVAATMASRGIATVSINVVGHGGGALGTLTVARTNAAPVTVPAGGRGFDQNGDGVIGSTEGVDAVPPQTIVSSRDGLRQTVIDYMQLVRQIQDGVDVDGDGSVDLSPQRLYYAGQSFGGIYGTILLGVEPALRAGVPNVPGGSIPEVARLGFFRFLSAITLASRQPSLLNLPPLAGVPVPFNLVFNENLPQRDLPPLTNTVPGAMAIQAFLDRSQWATQTGNPVSYAPFIRRQPLAGHAAKPVIVQFAKGDPTVPNPTTSAILRAGGLSDRATYFRNDLAYAANAAFGKDPHTFLTNIANPVQAPAAVAAQMQIAFFFASDGTMTIDPDGAGPLFEVPIAGPLPEGLSYIP